MGISYENERPVIWTLHYKKLLQALKPITIIYPLFVLLTLKQCEHYFFFVVTVLRGIFCDNNKLGTWTITLQSVASTTKNNLSIVYILNIEAV